MGEIIPVEELPERKKVFFGRVKSQNSVVICHSDVQPYASYIWGVSGRGVIVEPNIL